LVLISAQEDISMAEDAPPRLALYAYQAALVDKAAAAGVPFVLLIGPADDPPRGVRAAGRDSLRDARVSSALDRRASPLGGMGGGPREVRRRPTIPDPAALGDRKGKGRKWWGKRAREGGDRKGASEGGGWGAAPAQSVPWAVCVLWAAAPPRQGTTPHALPALAAEEARVAARVPYKTLRAPSARLAARAVAARAAEILLSPEAAPPETVIA